MLEQLKKEVLKATAELVKAGLVTLTWGNVSGIQRKEGLIVIKPSGLDYDRMTASDMVVVDLEGRSVEGKLVPSSDTPTHIELYKAFPGIGGITHTHSVCATTFAQALREIPCFGTTHADHFSGPIPVTRLLTKEEVSVDYERNTGKIIVERFAQLDPMNLPSVLVAGHAPFSWGLTPADSVKHSLILERIAEMALGALQLNPNLSQLPDYLLAKHFERKHGPNAYYGQKKT